MSEIDKDIASKHDLRTREGRSAANADQKDREDSGNFKGALLFSLFFIGYLSFTIFDLIEGKGMIFLDEIPYSDFSWWGWLLLALGLLMGVGSLWVLFTEHLERLIVNIILIGIVIGGIYFFF